MSSRNNRITSLLTLSIIRIWPTLHHIWLELHWEEQIWDHNDPALEEIFVDVVTLYFSPACRHFRKSSIFQSLISPPQKILENVSSTPARRWTWRRRWCRRACLARGATGHTVCLRDGRWTSFYISSLYISQSYQFWWWLSHSLLLIPPFLPPPDVTLRLWHTLLQMESLVY